MNKVFVVSSLALALIGTTPSAEAVPKKRIYLYQQSYDYAFSKDTNVVKCITRASAVLAKNGLGEQINTSINEGEQFGIVYGWNRNGTESAEIACNRTEKLSLLAYAAFTDKGNKMYKKWKVLKNSRW